VSLLSIKGLNFGLLFAFATPKAAAPNSNRSTVGFLAPLFT